MSTCPRCGNQSPEGFRFCGSCGAPLAEGEPARETRRIVTVLFCDVTGSTALGERLDPESLRRVMARYFEIARRVIERHGGTVEKFIGDAVMAVFGVPVLHEDDALRAVRAAAELRERLAALDAELEQDLGVTLTVRTGVNTGEVVAGTAERLATGDAVVVAQRLQGAAAPGEVLLGEATHRLVRDAIEAEATGALELKGKSEAVEAFRLVAVRPDEPGVGRRLDAPLVGRERELRRLHDAFESTVARRSCELFTLLGAAGVGKSRLVAELVRSLAGPARVLGGRCLPYGEGITYWALAEILREAAGIGQADAAGEARAKLAALVGGDDGDRVAAELAPVLGLDEGGTGELAWAARRLLESLAREEPLVLVLDDVHWAEPAFLDLVEHVADWARDAPLLLVCVARPELLDGRPAWSGGKLNATTLLLEPLSEDETAALLSNLLGGGQPAADLRRRVAEAAEGNPLFVEELLAMLLEEGVVQREDGVWVARGDLGAVHVPPTISALLSARLDRLERPERDALASAAVEGKVFHLGAVAALSEPPAREGVRECVMALLRKDLVRPDRSALAGEEAFRFRHVLIRDAAYDALPKARRAELHEAFAGWLEATARDRLPELEEIVGYHLEQAYRSRAAVGPVDDRARALAQRAGEQLARSGFRAAGRGDPAAASSLLRRAVSVLPQSDRWRLDALVELGRALNDCGAFDEGRAVVEEAAALAAAAGDPLAGARARLTALAALFTTDTDGAVSAIPVELEAAMPLFEAAGDDAALAEAWLLESYVRWLRGYAQPAAAAARRGEGHARRAGAHRLEAELAGWALTALIVDPTPVPEGLDIARAVSAGSPGGRLEGHALHVRASLEAMGGNVGAGRQLHRSAVEYFNALGHEVLAASIEGHTGVAIELLAGNPEAAAEQAVRAYERLERMGESGYRSTTGANAAEALAAVGRFPEALAYAEASKRAAGHADAAGQWAWRHARADALHGLGRLEEARELVGAALELVDRSDYLVDQARVRLSAAAIHAASDEREAARRLAGEAVERFERKGVTPEVGRARGVLAGLA